MYRVILIDDEQIILEGLKRVVDWAGFGCSVVACAGDAAGGAAAIRSHNPHILFTDIRMPDTDGLTMLAGLKSEFPDMQVTVLTGYRDFDYAQTAIRLGVVRFLLKPSRMDEINEAMQTMVDNLNRLNGGDERKNDEGDETPSQSANSFIVKNALEYIENNHAGKLTLQEVADHCYVSQWHLSKLLNKHTEKSFYELLNAARISAAKRFLRDPSLKIGDVCELVGYTDTGHFARVFRRIAGMNANEYRNTLSDRDE